MGASLVAEKVKNPPAMKEILGRSLVQEDPLEEEKATHSSILAWRIPWTKEAGWLQFLGLQRVGHYWLANILTFTRHCGRNRIFCMENFGVNIGHFICMEVLSELFSFKRVLTFEILNIR